MHLQLSFPKNVMVGVKLTADVRIIILITQLEMGIEGVGDDSVGEGITQNVLSLWQKNKSMLIFTVLFLLKSFHKEFISEK